MPSTCIRFFGTLFILFAYLFTNAASADVSTKNLTSEIRSGNIVIADVKGTGGSSGTVLDGYLINNTNKEMNLNVYIKDALHMINQGRGQNMYVLGVLGRSGNYYRSGNKSFIKLAPRKKLAVKFLAYCADFNKENPNSGESFLVSTPPQDMEALLARIASYHDKYPNGDITKAAQVAIWIARGESPSAIHAKFEYSQKDLELAYRFVETTQPQSNQTNPQTTSHQTPLTAEHNKLFDAIDYINKEIQNAPVNKFVNKEGKTLSAEQRSDFVETINYEKERINKFPSGVYNTITGSLQTGVVYPACRKREVLNLDCVDFDRSFSLPSQLGMSLELAIIADEKGYTHTPLARHYRYGLAVQKDIKSAYELYLKEKKLRDAYFQQVEIIRMLQEELMTYDSKVSDDGNLDSVTCDSYKNLTGESNCSKATLAEMFDALSIERIARASVPATLAALNGSWASDKPIVLGGKTKIKGFDFGKEGIMYDSVVNGARNFPSSFKYNLSGEALKFEITFSAAGLPINAIYIFDARMTKNGAVVLKYEGQTAVYKK